LENDGFTQAEITEAYNAGKDKYGELERMYDELVAEDLAFMHDPEVQLVNDNDYNRLASKKGYASFKRYFYDEIVGDEQQATQSIRVGKTKVSSMLKRKGSQKPILNPVYSGIKNHAEITRKSLKQIVYNRIGAIAGQLPDLFQELQLQALPDQTGRILFPQEKDKNIIMARRGYKRVPFLVDATIKNALDNVLTHQNIGIF